MVSFPTKRLRRRRHSEKIRRFFCETPLSIEDLILPVFVTEKHSEPNAIPTLPGHFQWPLSHLPRLIEQVGKKQISSLILFGIPKSKDSQGSAAYAEDGIIPKALSLIKRENPGILTLADICLCEYTDHGHCGILASDTNTPDPEVDNDATLPLLARAAVVYAQAGADILAPSDMMDGRVKAIRNALDAARLNHAPIISYAAKFASCFYGPFREAAQSAPRMGNRKGYQMSVANFDEAIEEIATDLEEGADGVIIKPAISSLDIIHQARVQFHCPITAYQVSGEYCMIRSCAEKGWIDLKGTMLESLTAIKRAGARRIISYFALDY